MFFSTYVLTKKGPLAKVWLAAHWDKKLTKNEVRVIDLSQTVLQIVKPAVPIALRTSGELMLGVVRIYALKVKHVQKDASDATTVLLRPKAGAGVGATTASGMLLNAKGLDAKTKDMASNAVTLDVVVNRAGLEQLCEADFTSIADIMLPAGNGMKKAAPEPAGGAWFAAEPSQLISDSQLGLTQDDINKWHEDLDKFDAKLMDQRDATSSSKSKSGTGSSVEAARGGAQQGADNAQQMLDGLGIGDFPLPPEGDLEGLLPPVSAQDGGALADPFDVNALEAPVDISAEGAAAEGAATAATGAADGTQSKKKLKVVHVLDTKDTTLSAAVLDKAKTNRLDTLCGERRHGPLDEEEATSRFILRNADTSVVDCVPLGPIGPASGLRTAFKNAMQATVEQAVEELEAARGGTGSTGPSARGSKNLGKVKDGEEDEAAAAALQAAPDQDALFEYNPEPIPSAEEEEPTRTSRGKRGRGGQEAEAHQAKAQFSASALATLEKLQGTLSGKTESITFSAFTKNKKRQEVARTFVDVLVLASHGRVSVDQRAAHGEIVLHKTAKLVEPVA